MSAQLKALRDENDKSLKRIQKLESELEDLRLKNNQLSDDLLKKAGKLSFGNVCFLKTCEFGIPIVIENGKKCLIYLMVDLAQQGFC